MNNNLTEIIFILDKSGSMHGLKDDTIGGFNAMIEKQKKVEGEALISTILFNSKSEVLHDRINIKDIKPLTNNDYNPSSTTALFDAIGDAIYHISSVHKYIREEDRPKHTMVVITTDGMENSSKKYDEETIFALINKKTEFDNWEFLFLGANIDAIKAAGNIGIKESNAVKYHCDETGLDICYGAVSDAIMSLRCNNALDEEWKAEIEKDFSSRE